MFQHLLIATDGSVTVATVTELWTEAAYATLPTPSLIRKHEQAAAGDAAVILEPGEEVRRLGRSAMRDPARQG